MFGFFGLVWFGFFIYRVLGLPGFALDRSQRFRRVVFAPGQFLFRFFSFFLSVTEPTSFLSLVIIETGFQWPRFFLGFIEIGRSPKSSTAHSGWVEFFFID